MSSQLQKRYYRMKRNAIVWNLTYKDPIILKVVCFGVRQSLNCRDSIAPCVNQVDFTFVWLDEVWASQYIQLQFHGVPCKSANVEVLWYYELWIVKVQNLGFACLRFVTMWTGPWIITELAQCDMKIRNICVASKWAW